MLRGILSFLASVGIALAQYYPNNGGLGFGQSLVGPRYPGSMYPGAGLNSVQPPNYYPGYFPPSAMANLPMTPGNVGINPGVLPMPMAMPMPMSMPVAMGSNENSNSNENANTNVNINSGSYRRSLHRPSKENSMNRNSNTNNNINA